VAEMKKIAVVLSGCGNRDGAEITESVATLIAIGEAGASYEIFAPDIDFAVIDFVTGERTTQTRNVLKEAARIARGNISNLKNLMAKDFDAIVFPGGMGTAVTFCTFVHEGAKCSVLPEVRRVILEFHEQEKPIGAICIAPALIACALREAITITIGNDRETSAELQKTGAHHETCAVDDFISDREHKIVTTPAYMYNDAKPFEIFAGIRKAIGELVEMA
jgi:enhancing lycopene biosynthesis protein 2